MRPLRILLGIGASTIFAACPVLPNGPGTNDPFRPKPVGDGTSASAKIGVQGGMVVHAQGAALKLPPAPYYSHVENNEFTVQLSAVAAAPIPEGPGGAPLPIGPLYKVSWNESNGGFTPPIVQPYEVVAPFDNTLPTALLARTDPRRIRVLATQQTGSSQVVLEGTTDFENGVVTGTASGAMVGFQVVVLPKAPPRLVGIEPRTITKVGVTIGPLVATLEGETSGATELGIDIPFAASGFEGTYHDGVLSGLFREEGRKPLTLFSYSGNVMTAVPIVIDVGPVTAKVPTASRTLPTVVAPGGGAAAVLVVGTDFTPASRVLVDGAPVGTLYRSASVLVARIPAARLAAEANLELRVETPDVGTSGPVSLSVTGKEPNPPATITSSFPEEVEAGGGNVNLEVYGSDFIAGIRAKVNGQEMPSTLVNPGRVAVTIPAELVAVPGELTIVVENPPPGGGAGEKVAKLVVNAKLETFHEGVGWAWPMIERDGFLYWGQQTAPSFVRKPVAGGDLAVVSPSGGVPAGLAIDGTVVFMGTRNAMNGGQGSLKRYDFDSGLGATAGTGEGQALAFDATHLYFARGYDLFRVVKSFASAPEDLGYAGPVSEIAVDDTHVYTALTFNTVSSPGGLLKRPKSSLSQPTAIVQGTTIDRMKMFGDYLYFGVRDAGLERVRKDGTERTSIAGGQVANSWDVDASGVYFANAQGLFRVRHGSTTFERLGKPSGFPWTVAAGAGHVYVNVINQQTQQGSILRVAKE